MTGVLKGGQKNENFARGELLPKVFWRNARSSARVSWKTVMDELIGIFPDIEVKEIKGHMTQGGTVLHLEMPVPNQISRSAIRGVKGLYVLQPDNASEAIRMKAVMMA